jgi:small-conductance mechanosensitive channel
MSEELFYCILFLGIPIITCAIFGKIKGRKWYWFALLGFLSIPGLIIATILKSKSEKIYTLHTSRPDDVPEDVLVYHKYTSSSLIKSSFPLIHSPKVSFYLFSFLTTGIIASLIVGFITGFIAYFLSYSVLGSFSHSGPYEPRFVGRHEILPVIMFICCVAGILFGSGFVIKKIIDRVSIFFYRVISKSYSSTGMTTVISKWFSFNRSLSYTFFVLSIIIGFIISVYFT